MRQALHRTVQNCARMETLDAYLDALASAQPAPGGGSAAAVAGALGAALVAMVANVTAGSPRFADRRAAADALASEAATLADVLGRDLRERDERAFGAVIAAQALPKATPDEKERRTAALQNALAGAAEAPLETARTALEVLHRAERALSLENANLASDAGCAAELAAAAVRAAAYNVRANHPYMKDAAAVERQRGALAHIERESDRLLASIRSALAREN